MNSGELPNASLDDQSLVIVRSAFSSGDWVAQVQAVDLSGLTLNDEGLFVVYGEGWQNSVAGVVLVASPASSFVVYQQPVFGDMLDAVIYGNASVSNPQMAAM